MQTTNAFSDKQGFCAIKQMLGIIKRNETKKQLINGMRVLIFFSSLKAIVYFILKQSTHEPDCQKTKTKTCAALV